VSKDPKTSFSFNYEKFDQIFGRAKLYQNNFLAINNTYFRSFISGKNSYSNGKHSFNIKIEQVDIKG
jgi:hypothetical protein